MEMRRGGKERETGGPETNKKTQGEGKDAEREKCDLLHKGDTEAVSERLRYRVRAGGTQRQRDGETDRDREINIPEKQRETERETETGRLRYPGEAERDGERDRKTEIPCEGTGQKCCPSL